MRDPNRIRRKNSAAASQKQHQTRPCCRKVTPRPVTLKFQNSKGRALGQLELPGKIFAKFQAAASRAGLAVDQFMLLGLESQVSRIEARLQCPAENETGKASKRARNVLIQMTYPDGKKWAQLALSPEDYSALISVAEKCNQSLPEFIEQCCREKLARDLEAMRIAKLIGLDDKLAKALELICRWENEEMAGYCPEGVLLRMNVSLDDMQDFAANLDKRADKKERDWAFKLFAKVNSLMGEGRWGVTKRDPGATKPQTPAREVSERATNSDPGKGRTA